MASAYERADVSYAIGIIGASGFIGSGLVSYGDWNGRRIKAITRSNYEDFKGQHFDVLINANGNSKKYLARNEPLQDFELSVTSVARSLRDFKYGHYIYLSSCDVYNSCSNTRDSAESVVIDPSRLSNYGFHKLQAEGLVRRYAPRHLVLRCGGFVGPGLKKNGIYDVLNGQPLWVSDESRYQYMHVHDAASIIYELIDREFSGMTLNLCSRGTISLREVKAMSGQTVPSTYATTELKREVYEISTDRLAELVNIPTTLEGVQKYLMEWKAERQ